MMQIETLQIKAIHALLPAAIKSDPEAKAELIAQFTGNQAKVSTKDLSFHQANELIKSLKGKPVFIGTAIKGNGTSFFHFDFGNKQHRTILSLAHQYGWEIPQAGKHIADMTRVAEWLMSKRAPVQKSLVTQTPKELSKTIVALENMVAKKFNKNAEAK
jgi:hypothetical protein